MEKIVEYKIVKEFSPEETMEVVNKLIGEGWQPQGGVGFNAGYFFQALVKYEA